MPLSIQAEVAQSPSCQPWQYNFTHLAFRQPHTDLPVLSNTSQWLDSHPQSPSRHNTVQHTSRSPPNRIPKPSNNASSFQSSWHRRCQFPFGGQTDTISWTKGAFGINDNKGLIGPYCRFRWSHCFVCPMQTKPNLSVSSFNRWQWDVFYYIQLNSEVYIHLSQLHLNSVS